MMILFLFSVSVFSVDVPSVNSLFHRTKATFDRQYDLSAVREIGFDEHVDTVQGYYTAFDRMKAARIIP
jgi:hypothetical protein